MENELVSKEQSEKVRKKKFMIFGYDIYSICAYFLLYSVMGYFVETLFALITKGTWESRQSFLYGPFCGIYGLGAVFMILFLHYFNKSIPKLFVGGAVVGTIVEYFVSLFAEVVLHVKWWDYTGMLFSINGRVCLLFTIFWGILAVVFMYFVHPEVEKLIGYLKVRFSIEFLKKTVSYVSIFVLFDAILTGIALDLFFIRKTHDFNLNVDNKEVVEAKYEKIYGNDNCEKIINKFFDDRKMIKTFPNLKTQGKDGEIIYFDCYVGNLKPYYIKFRDK